MIVASDPHMIQRKPGTILVVEDDVRLRRLTQMQLEKLGYEAMAATDVTEGLKILRSEPVDLVICDLHLPHGSGLDLLKMVRVEHPETKFVIVTAYSSVSSAIEAMKAGAVDFIEKPFDDAALLSAIRAALDTRAAKVGDSAAKKEAEARLADLSPRERDVLLGLVAGKINKVIAHDLNISPRTVEVYRANLMAKTGAHSMSELMRLALAAGL